MEEKRAPRELLISAIKNLDKAREDFELSTFGWPGRECGEAKFNALREVMLDALLPLFVPPADPNEEPYNVAERRWDTLKEAMEIGGSPSSLLLAAAARAMAEAAEKSEADWKIRKAEMAAETA